MATGQQHGESSRHYVTSHSDAEAGFSNGEPIMRKGLTTAQTMGFFQKEWDPDLPANFNDDLSQQPEGVRSYKENIRNTYGMPPADREDLWKAAPQLPDQLHAPRGHRIPEDPRCDGPPEPVGQHDCHLHQRPRRDERRTPMHQKGAIHYDEAAVVNLTAVVPGGPQGQRTCAVGSHLDLAPTLLDFAGVSEEEMTGVTPNSGAITAQDDHGAAQPGPRGIVEQPGDGALICWDGLNMLDPSGTSQVRSWILC